MSAIVAAFNTMIYQPLLNGLVLIYTYLPYQDLGFAIVVLTAVVRIILHPFVVRSVRSQETMTRLQPRLREIQKQYKNNKEEQARQTMALWREEGAHPLSGCLPLLVQLPVLIGLYQLFWKGITSIDTSLLYAVVPKIESFNTLAFGIVNLAESNPALAILAGVAQYFQSRYTMPQQPAAEEGSREDMAKMLQWQTLYVLPIIIIVISWRLPSALAFYWTVLSLFAIVQQLWIQRRIKHERDQRTNQPNSRQDGDSSRR